jgi:hypothetical protein
MPHGSVVSMKWLLGLMLLLALAMAVLLLPIQGRTLWSRGAVRVVAQFAAHGLRAGWDAVASLGKERGEPTHAPPAHSPRPPVRKTQAASGSPRTSREGIVQQTPKETLRAQDQAALESLIAHSR